MTNTRRGLVIGVVVAVSAMLAAAANTGADAVAVKSGQVDALFQPFTVGVQPGAAVLVINDGEIEHQAGYGYANLEQRVPIDRNSSFRLASVSKQFTAMAIMVLAANGVLSYDDPVSRFLPALEPYAGVTVRHLMTHTGGLPDYYDRIDIESGRPDNADALALLSEIARPDFAPGERHEYSNAGYDMLANLVEAASGMPFAAFMRERVFLPAGMRGALIRDQTNPRIANRVLGYAPAGDDFALNDDHALNGIVGSGGMYATLEDFHSWIEALRPGALVDAAALEEAFTPAALRNGERIGYGFGWRIDHDDGRRRLRHGGSWVGFRSHIAHYPDDRLSIVILSNRADFRAEDYVDAIAGIWLGGGSWPAGSSVTRSSRTTRTAPARR